MVYNLTPSTLSTQHVREVSQVQVSPPGLQQCSFIGRWRAAVSDGISGPREPRARLMTRTGTTEILSLSLSLWSRMVLNVNFSVVVRW